MTKCSLDIEYLSHLVTVARDFSYRLSPGQNGVASRRKLKTWV